MQRSMRRVSRIVIVSAIAAFAAVPLFATSASAVTANSVCVFNVLPNPIPAGGGLVHIEGTAPAGSTVTAFSGATPLVSAVTNANGTFSSGNFNVTPPINISATFTLAGSSYATGCNDPNGLLVVTVLAEAAARQQQVAALAFTGSNNTGSFVLIGVTAIIVGVVLTVGARRRSRISS